MQLSNAHILKFVAAKLHTLSMNISLTKHMQLLCKLSIDRFTTCIPRVQNKNMADFTEQAQPQSFIAFFIKESIHEFS